MDHIGTVPNTRTVRGRRHTGRVSAYTPFPADGHTVTWSTWDNDATEELTLLWENEGWTASGIVGREQVQYVLRMTATWQVRQILLFRDMDEPDLWLATDGTARWGEMNGAHRVELDGCYDLHLPITPFTNTLPIRRLPLHVGHSADLPVVHVDVETLEVRADHQRYTRIDTHRWAFTHLETGVTHEFDVDDFGLVMDYPTRFRRAIAAD
jgi:hypothetical protein